MPFNVERKLAWHKKGSGYLPPLPNTGSELTTATSKIIDLHYSNLRIGERWTWDRYQRLCSVLKITEPELASLVCMPHDYLPKLKANNQLPGLVTGGGRAIGMLLTILEARILKRLVPDVIEQPFPNLQAAVKQRNRT